MPDHRPCGYTLGPLGPVARGCVALAAGGALCAVHRRTPRPDELRWLRWADQTPSFRDVRADAARRPWDDETPWWARPFRVEDHG